MRLRVFVPDKLLVDSEVNKVVAEAGDGSFCLLPRHIDFVAALVPGILTYERTESGGEAFVAVDDGIIVKTGDDVTVSTRKAIGSAELGSLEGAVRKEFLALDDQETQIRSLIAKLETSFIRGAFRVKQW
jgi:F-type H+-transporting ATPase subunit epsilon